MYRCNCVWDVDVALKIFNALLVWYMYTECRVSEAGGCFFSGVVILGHRPAAMTHLCCSVPSS